MRDRKIIQIIPPDGWLAVYIEAEDKKVTYPLICFALVDEIREDGQPYRYVTPMDADLTGRISFCKDSQNFIGLVHQERNKYL